MKMKSLVYNKCCQVGLVCADGGSVWIVQKPQSKKRLAAKIYDLEKCDEELPRIQNEISLLKKLNHPNIVKCIDSFVHGNNLWAVMPLIGYTSASRLVHSHFSHGISENALAFIMKDALTGLVYLHSRGIIHRTIKGSHILVDASGNSLLTGFRHSTDMTDYGKRDRMIHSYSSDAAFHINWASPELLKQDLEGYCEKTDIYSLGVTACELGNGEVPYCKYEPQLIIVEKIYGREPFIYDANTCKLFYDSGVGESYGEYLSSFPEIGQKNFSQCAHQFVADCLTFNQKNRLSAENLLEHLFIKQIKKCQNSGKRLKMSQLLHPVTPIDEETDLGECAKVFADEDAAHVHAEIDTPEWEWS